MPILAVSRDLNVPVADPYTLLADVSKIHLVHPGVERVDLLSASVTGVDARRRCVFYDGTDIVETVTAAEANRLLRIEGSDFGMPLKEMIAEITFESLAADRTRVTFTVTVSPDMGCLGPVMYKLVMKPKFTALLTNVLAGLEHHLLTGEEIGKGWTEAKAAKAKAKGRVSPRG